MKMLKPELQTYIPICTTPEALLRAHYRNVNRIKELQEIYRKLDEENIRCRHSAEQRIES